jgi:hypothetical protein
MLANQLAKQRRASVSCALPRHAESRTDTAFGGVLSRKPPVRPGHNGSGHISAETEEAERTCVQCFKDPEVSPERDAGKRTPATAITANAYPLGVPFSRCVTPEDLKPSGRVVAEEHRAFVVIALGTSPRNARGLDVLLAKTLAEVGRANIRRERRTGERQRLVLSRHLRHAEETSQQYKAHNDRIEPVDARHLVVRLTSSRQFRIARHRNVGRSLASRPKCHSTF